MQLASRGSRFVAGAGHAEGRLQLPSDEGIGVFCSWPVRVRRANDSERVKGHAMHIRGMKHLHESLSSGDNGRCARKLPLEDMQCVSISGAPAGEIEGCEVVEYVIPGAKSGELIPCLRMSSGPAGSANQLANELCPLREAARRVEASCFFQEPLQGLWP